MANTNAITAVYNVDTQVINATGVNALTQVVNGVTSNVVLSMPANANVDGHAFKVRLIGTATGGANTLQFSLYSGTVVPTNPLAVFTVSGAVATTGSNFALEATFSWDSVSGLLNGVFTGVTSRILTPLTVTTAVPVIASAAGLQFVAAAAFSTATATNTVTVEEFTIEQI